MSHSRCVEVFSVLFGGCVVIPVAVGLTVLIVKLRKTQRISRLACWVWLVLIWSPVLLATVSEAWWMLVEEPRRIDAGQPI
jgi:hypothetical protein